MKPVGPLMREHRLIERIIPLLSSELAKMNGNNKADIELITVTVDFFRTYADRTHHGKEEDILFKKLAQKKLSREHEKTMNELIEEHVYGRKLVTALLNAKNAYTKGDPGELKTIIACVKDLIGFYPVHIEKEDKRFFYPILEYLSKEEQDTMLQEFWEFDRKVIHEKYQRVLEEFETRSLV